MKRSIFGRGIFRIASITVLAAGIAAFAPASAGVRPSARALVVTCSSTNPCQTYSNSSSGSGVKGTSAQGQGVSGSTTFNSTSLSNGQAGVMGVDSSTSGIYDAGVKGTSPKATGVYGRSGTSAFNGITTRAGVFGDSYKGVGVAAASHDNVALRAESVNTDSIDSGTESNSITAGVGFAGVNGHDDSTDHGHLNSGVAGFSSYGFGIRAHSFYYVALHISGGYENGSTEYPALSIVGESADHDLIDACSFYNGVTPCYREEGVSLPAFTVTQDGNEYLLGTIVTGGSCRTGCIATGTSAPRRVRLYTPQESLPTVEDFGSARLVNGHAYVRLDPAFANTIDSNAPYMVFITPGGDNNGLYVTGKSLAGFMVSESHGGRSTIDIDYRIVAKPFGAASKRLKTVAVPARNAAWASRR